MAFKVIIDIKSGIKLSPPKKLPSPIEFLQVCKYKPDKILEINNSKYGDFFIKANIQNIKKLIDKKISIILRPKMLSKSIFVDFNDPITSVFFTSLIFSIILNLIIFYIFYMLKHVFIFKF